MTTIKTDVIDMTPELATELLKRNKMNRTINRHHVARLTQAILDDEWQLNGQGVSIDSDGFLQDGQHRLTAIVKSGKTVPILVIEGVSPDARQTVDIGRKRLVADEFMMRGEEHSKNIAAILMMMKRLESMFGSGYGTVLTAPEAIKLLDEHPLVRESAAKGSQMGNREILPVPMSVFGYCDYLFRSINADQADEFWEIFTTGKFTGPGDPRFVVQKTLNRLAASRDFSTGSFKNKALQAAYLIKAWNSWRSGKDVVIVRMRRDEKFPKAR